MTICAWLEEIGYRRWEIGRLSRRYIRLVLQHRRDKHGKLVTPAQQRPLTKAQELEGMLRRKNYPPERIKERVREIMAGEQAERAARGRRGKDSKPVTQTCKTAERSVDVPERVHPGRPRPGEAR